MSLTNPNPLTFLVFGATGRTGIPFIRFALERGHNVHAYARTSSKLPSDIRANSRLRIWEGAIDDVATVRTAIRTARPTVIYSMLSSDYSPHTQMTSNTKAVLEALTEEYQFIGNVKSDTDAVATNPPAPDHAHQPLHWISISGFGFGPTYPFLTWSGRRLVGMARYLWPAFKDFDAQEKLLNSALTTHPYMGQTIVLPPFLTDKQATGKMRKGDVMEIKDEQSTFKTITRQDMAKYMLELGEQAAEKKVVPRWVTLFNL